MTEWLNSYQEEQWVSTFTETEWIDTLPVYIYSIHHNLVLNPAFYYLAVDSDDHNLTARKDFTYLQIQGGV